MLWGKNAFEGVTHEPLDLQTLNNTALNDFCSRQITAIALIQANVTPTVLATISKFETNPDEL
jgi:hypothetical protein